MFIYIQSPPCFVLTSGLPQMPGLKSNLSSWNFPFPLSEKSKFPHKVTDYTLHFAVMVGWNTTAYCGQLGLMSLICPGNTRSIYRICQGGGGWEIEWLVGLRLTDKVRRLFMSESSYEIFQAALSPRVNSFQFSVFPNNYEPASCLTWVTLILSISRIIR